MELLLGQLAEPQDLGRGLGAPEFVEGRPGEVSLPVPDPPYLTCPLPKNASAVLRAAPGAGTPGLPAGPIAGQESCLTKLHPKGQVHPPNCERVAKKSPNSSPVPPSDPFRQSLGPMNVPLSLKVPGPPSGNEERRKKVKKPRIDPGCPAPPTLHPSAGSMWRGRWKRPRVRGGCGRRCRIPRDERPSSRPPRPCWTFPSRPPQAGGRGAFGPVLLAEALPTAIRPISRFERRPECGWTPRSPDVRFARGDA